MIFFTSDLHFGHKNILGYCGRPWLDLDSMAKGLIDNWNSVVSSEDDVFVLGDMSFCGVERTKEIIKSLSGKKTLVMGNHDFKWSASKWIDVGFDYVIPPIGTRFYADSRFYISHFPFKDFNHDQRRFDAAQIEDDGETILLHGHVHTSYLKKNRMINVGCDVWGWRPVAFEELKKLAFC